MQSEQPVDSANLHDRHRGKPNQAEDHPLKAKREYADDRQQHAKPAEQERGLGGGPEARQFSLHKVHPREMCTKRRHSSGL